MDAEPPKLKRALNLPLLVLYGLGTTIGAGIYALVGEIAGVAGYGAPASFLVASIVAGFTACSFAEMAARYPRAAGAALYVQQGLGSTRLSLLVGLLVVLAGTVSAAALINGFTGYLQAFVNVDRVWVVIGVALLLGLLAGWGIAESVTVAAVVTLVEIGGLLVVIGVGADSFTALPDRWTEFLPGSQTVPWLGMFMGVTLAFYAFIGFEDMVDVAEEVNDVSRNMPRAILLTLGISTLLYLLLMMSALLTLSPQTLQDSRAPLATLYQAHTGRSPAVIGIIALFAIINGALVQMIMTSRVLYGLSSRQQLPAVLGRINARTRTPLIATALATSLMLGLALYGRLAGLATATSALMLTIFALVNLSLWSLKGRESAPRDVLEFPRFVPGLGFLLSVGFVMRELFVLLA